MEGKLGTVGAKAIAYKLSERKLHRKHMLWLSERKLHRKHMLFVSGFYPHCGINQEIWRRAVTEGPSILRNYDHTSKCKRLS
ncbi:hypothetical protein D3C87_575780 [compost metagenome]